MKAILSKSLIPAVLVIAALAAGTGLLAGYIDNPIKAPQTAVEAQHEGCPHMAAGTCPKMAATSADPQVHAAPCGGTEADATACTGAEDCPLPCCQKTGETPAAGCTMEKPQTTGCPFMSSSSEAVTPCGTSGCTQEE